MLVDPDVIGIIIALVAFTATVLGGVSRMLTTQTRALEVRFDRIDERFDKVDERFERVDERFAKVEGGHRRCPGVDRTPRRPSPEAPAHLTARTFAGVPDWTHGPSHHRRHRR